MSPHRRLLLAMLAANHLSIALAENITASSSESQPTPILGFPADAIASQRALEIRFDTHVSADEIATRQRMMSAAPNHVGSAHNKVNAEFTLSQFRTWGWTARIETFEVLYPTPKRLSLELLGPEPFQATLTEPPIPGDATSARTHDVLPAYLVFGADGEVTAPLVYVNYGMAEDYAVLARLGISVKGKIVISRFGGGWRGLKPKLAYEHGAVGCIIYSDPAEDGYGVGDVYPKGAWRPSTGIQRGSVLDLPVAAGDPLTPGLGATQSASRLAIAQSTTIMKIPTLPISYGDAQHFLAALEGPVAPANWRGALPITYHLGPSSTRVRLVVESNWRLETLHNVIAEMRGADFPDEWIIRGNNRDAWVYGAWVALSGHSAMMQEAKAIGALAKAGWRPHRTILYASWDGEEAGLLGSTEWVEKHADELLSKAALYINSGINGRGFLDAAASPTTHRLVDQAARDVADPQTQASIRARVLAYHKVEAFNAGARGGELDRTEGMVPISDLGAGSDYTPFAQHLGIASIDLAFGGEDEQAGIYHSAYDTFEHFERFGDPGLAYGVALAKLAGRIVLRAAGAEILPIEFSGLAERIGAQAKEIRELVDSLRRESETGRVLAAHGAFTLADDPTKPAHEPVRQGRIPEVNLSPLDEAAAQLTASAQNYSAALDRMAGMEADNSYDLNLLLGSFEQCAIDPKGLPGRPWYRNLLYAPGMTTGYAAKSLPGIREAVEGYRWEEADEYIRRTARIILNCSSRIDRATMLLRMQDPGS